LDRDDTMIAALRQSYQQQLGADMAQKIVSDLTQPQFVFDGGKNSCSRCGRSGFIFLFRWNC
jgi:hypothetical protein